MLVATSCDNNDFDCPGKSYYSEIALGNHTDYEIDVELFPKAVNAVGLYLASDMGGQHLETHFTMEPQQIYSEDFQYVLFTSSDTSASPKGILSYKFDSIKLTIHDNNNSQIFISPDTCINNSQNPFIEDSNWVSEYRDFSMPDNDCPNTSEIKSNHFYIDL